MIYKLDPLTVNAYSRPGKPLTAVRAIVLHWTMAPGQDIKQTRQYWEDRFDGNNGFGGAHMLIDGERVLETIPLNEMAYHVGAERYTEFAVRYIGSYPNAYTIGIELAHEDWLGKPSDATWDTTVQILRDLTKRFNVTPHMIVTHFDVTGLRPQWRGLPCHRWFVEQPGELARLRADVLA